MSIANVNRISREMSLRAPLRTGLLALDSRLRELDENGIDMDSLPDVEAVTGKTFQTTFPSFCFHIATGVGKTRLLGACIAHLYQTRGWTDFFLLVPGATIYNKFRQRDFVRGKEKFIFAGLEQFPDFNLITADNYSGIVQQGIFDAPINIYLFNIGKIFEGRDRTFKFSRENADGLGLQYPEGLASYLQEKRPVILMDEAHRYYAPASLSAMNRLKPRLGIEFTATPTHSGNIISRFHLGEAIDAGYVKRPRISRVLNDNTPDNEKDQMILLDAVRNHERKKGLLDAYCRNQELPLVRPILLVTTADTADGDRVAAYLRGETELKRKNADGAETTEKLFDGVPFGKGTLLEGLYADREENGRAVRKVLLVHSKTEEDTDQAVRDLETNDYEIVVHVNKLKEGLDVSNIYTLAVLRAFTANVLTEQIIGRGLRLPFGALVPDGTDLEETVADLNALDIMPHREYQKVVDEADAYLKGRIDERIIDRNKPKDAPVTREVTVEPSASPALQIEIPIIESEVTDTGRRLTVFPMQPGLALMNDDDFKRRIELTDIQSRRVTLTEEYGPGEVPDGVRYLVRAVLERCQETDAEDAPVLADIARAYLTQLRDDENTWPYAIALRKKAILEDFITQIKTRIDTLHPTLQVRRDGVFVFKPWTKSVPQDYVTPLRRDNDPTQEKAGTLIGGYVKSLYAENHFDSKQEKLLADALERDKKVRRWVRLPTKQLRIGLARTGYYPDFVAVIADAAGNERYYLLEVKAANKCDPNNPDPDVKRKYFAALDWVRKSNTEGGEPDKWCYRLLLDKEIEQRKDNDIMQILDGSARQFSAT